MTTQENQECTYQNWVNNYPSAWQKITIKIRGLWYKLKKIWPEFSFWGILRLGCIIALGSSPLLYKIFVFPECNKEVEMQYASGVSQHENILADTPTPRQTIAVIVVICIMLYSYFYDNIIKTRKENKHIADIVSSNHATLGEILKQALAENHTHYAGLNDTLINNVLSLICDELMVYYGIKNHTYFQATLLLYDSKKKDRFKISNRARPNRPVKKVVNAKTLIAYYVCTTGKSFAVHDFDKTPFPVRGASTPEKPPYKSILTFPLIDMKTIDTGLCYGALCIDSANTYQFIEHEKIRLMLEPHLQILRWSIHQHPDTVELKLT